MIYSKTIISVALSALLLMGMAGCNSDSDPVVEPVAELSSDQAAIVELTAASEAAIAASLVGVADEDKIPFGDGSFSPFERVAVFPTVKKADGTLDEVATYAKVTQLATTFAKYVANTDEPATDSTKFKASNWIVGGIESGTTVNNFDDATVQEHGVLAIPTKLPIDSTIPVSKINTKKVALVEVCNSSYAGQALGVNNVGGDTGDKVPNGIYHTTALPCEVSIYNDADAIYVDMLNPETIFTTFFTEVFTDPVMANLDFRNAMMALPTQVKNEISDLIYNAFDGAGETYTKTQIKMGTIYSSMSKSFATADTSNGGAEPYRHYTYTSDNTKEFTTLDAKAIAQKLIAVMTSDADGLNVGIQETALKNVLPSTIAGINPSWRSGRLEPLKVPGGSWIVESCSPVYAKEALTTGEYHTPALPCEIAVFVNPEDPNKIDISFLNPEFMFGALFADGMVDMSADQIAAFNTIIANINGDLKTIVDYAMENNVTAIGNFTGENTKNTPVIY